MTTAREVDRGAKAMASVLRVLNAYATETPRASARTLAAGDSEGNASGREVTEEEWRGVFTRGSISSFLDLDFAEAARLADLITS